MGEIVDDVLKVGSFGLIDTDFSGKEAGREAQQAITSATETQVGFQREALDYLKEREALPQQFREGALTRLGGLYGLEGGEGSQQQLIDQAKASPLYQSLIGGREAGEESIARHASMTGGLRSGGTTADLAEYNTNLENTALLTSYNQQLQGLQGLASLPSNVNQIAGATAGIGQTMAQGQIAGSQAQIQARNMGMNQLLGIGEVGVNAYTAFSDIRLKENIRLVGTFKGHNWYKWDWNEEAAKLNLFGEGEGVMAHEVYETRPEVIGDNNGYITVDYEVLEVA